MVQATFAQVATGGQVVVGGGCIWPLGPRPRAAPSGWCHMPGCTERPPTLAPPGLLWGLWGNCSTSLSLSLRVHAVGTVCHLRECPGCPHGHSSMVLAGLLGALEALGLGASEAVDLD